jgi:hypothetical protein
MNARTEMLGVFSDMPAADYFAAEGVNNSLLKDMAKSPAHAFALHLAPDRPVREQTPSMFTGTLAHCAQLEPDAMAARYVVVPDDAPRRPTAAQWKAKKPSPDSIAAMDWWADFNTCAEGLQIVTAEQYTATKGQLAAIQRSPELAALFGRGAGEQSVFWRDPITGLICKCRPDWVHPLDDGRDILVDLKSTADASPEGFSRTVWNFGYHRAAAWYSKGWAAATGRDVAAFVFGAVTSAYPFLAAPYMLDEDTLRQGADESRRLLDRYAECLRTDSWPGYGGLREISLPAWAKQQPTEE